MVNPILDHAAAAVVVRVKIHHTHVLHVGVVLVVVTDLILAVEKTTSHSQLIDHTSMLVNDAMLVDDADHGPDSIEDSTNQSRDRVNRPKGGFSH